MKTYNFKFVDFLSTNNTLIIKNDSEFKKFVRFLKKLNMETILKDNVDFNDWLSLSRINNCFYQYVIFEYNNSKGLTFGYSIEESKKWYEIEPLTIDDLEI